MSRLKQFLSFVAVALLLGTLGFDAPTVRGQGTNFESGSNGSDGAFAPTSNIELPARTYHFTTITIPANVTVTFARSTNNPPVILLATGNVSIYGVLNVSGKDGQSDARGGLGGPGGFNGGDGAVGTRSTRGFTGEGPGGGGGGYGLDTNPPVFAGGGSYSTPGTKQLSYAAYAAAGKSYGTPFLQPLVGGSGGGGGGLPVPETSNFSIVTGSGGGGNGTNPIFIVVPRTGGGGGGGGGAILIASTTQIELGPNSQIMAKGGNASLGQSYNGGQNVGGGGAGGAVRIVAPTVVSSATAVIGVFGGASNGAFTYGAFGGWGYIRVEAFNRSGFFADTSGFPITYGRPGPTALTQGSTLKIASIAGIATPTNPAGSFQFQPDVTIPTAQQNPVPIVVNATSIPVGTVVVLTVAPEEGQSQRFNLPPLAGTEAASSTTGNITLPNGMSMIYATASVGLVSTTGPVAINGDVIERKEYMARLGGRTEISYLGKSGRRYSEAEFSRAVSVK